MILLGAFVCIPWANREQCAVLVLQGGGGSGGRHVPTALSAESVFLGVVTDEPGSFEGSHLLLQPQQLSLAVLMERTVLAACRSLTT